MTMKPIEPKDSAMFIATANALSGAVGGIIATLMTFPLDIIRCELQAKATDLKSPSSLSDIEEEEEMTDPGQGQGKGQEIGISSVITSIYSKYGISGFYRALSSQLIVLFVSDIVYFFVVTLIKQVLYGRREVNAISNLKASIIAGLVNVLITSPLWRAQVQLMLQKKQNQNQQKQYNYNGLFDALYNMYKQNGINDLYRGIGPSLWLISNPIIQFVSYEQLVNILKDYYSTKQLTSLIYFICGALAKTNATIFTYPLQVMQTQLRKPNSPFINMNDCLNKFVIPKLRSGDINPLFSGLFAKLYQTVSNSAIKFMIYENVLIIIKVLLRWIKKTLIMIIFTIFVSKSNNKISIATKTISK